MAFTRDDDEEPAALIDQLLEQLRLSNEGLLESSKQAVDRALAACRAAEHTVEKLHAEHVARHAAKNSRFDPTGASSTFAPPIVGSLAFSDVEFTRDFR